MSNRKVESELLGRYTVENISRDVKWTSDEPLDEGGENLGPRPTELLISSLTSCKLITMKMYAERKGWDIGRTKLTLTQLESTDKIVLEKKIIYPPHLTDEQKQRLTLISTKCPVAKSLAQSVEFV